MGVLGASLALAPAYRCASRVGGSVVTGPSLDLDALREARAWIEGLSDPLWPGLTESDWAGLMGRVLALVEEQRKENEWLRDALLRLAADDEARLRVCLVARRALDGPPDENKEPT